MACSCKKKNQTQTTQPIVQSTTEQDKAVKLAASVKETLQK